MAAEQSNAMDRRRALGLMGKGSVAAAAVAGTTAILGTGKAAATVVDVAEFRREFEAGPGSIPLDALLPDDADATQVVAAGESLRQRVRGYAQVLLDHGHASHEQLVAAKHSMLKAERDAAARIDQLSKGAITPAAARATVRATFVEYHQALWPFYV